MSTNNPFSANPYENPYNAPAQTSPIPQATTIPVFCKVMFIMALVFSSLRVIAVPFSIIGFFAIDQEDPMAASVIFEIVTGAMIAIFGLLSNSLLLARKSIGIPLAWVYILSVMASLGVAGWQTFVIFGKFEPGTPEFVGAIIGGLIAVLIRVALFGAYIAALLTYMSWFSRLKQ